MKFKVTMRERQKDGSVRELIQMAVCESEADVIKFYGLNAPDIVDCKIERI